MESQNRRPRRRQVRLIALVIMVAFVTLYGVVSLKGYDALSLSANGSKATPAGEFQDVSFPSRNQNYTVYAYLLKGKAGDPALINVHGWKGSRHDSDEQSRAAALRDLGYTVLSPDLSDNGGDTVGNGRIGMGYSERWDVLGAYDYLIGQGFAPDQIGLVGVSMGAVSSLLAAAAEPRIRAVWADSPYTRTDTIAAEQAEKFGFPRLIVPGGMVWALLATGDRLWEAAPLDLGPTLAANHQAISLIQCDRDSFVVQRHGEDLQAAYAAAQVQSALWIVACNLPAPSNNHTAGFTVQPEEYLRRLDGFFRKSLGGQ